MSRTIHSFFSVFFTEASSMLSVPVGEEGASSVLPSPSKPRFQSQLSTSSQHSNSHTNPMSFLRASFRRNNSCSQSNAGMSTMGQNGEDGSPITPVNQAMRLHTSKPTLAMNSSGLRRCNEGKSLRRKKRVIQMLGVVVAEFFFCWAPLYVMNTWYLFSPTELYNMIGPLGVSLVHLLAYISSCCNPITLFFMSKVFRSAFCHVFGCLCLSGRTSSTQRNDSVMLTRNRSLYNPSQSTKTNHVGV